MQPYRVPLYLSHRPQLHATFLKTRNSVYCTSLYVQWGSSTESIGAVMTLRPDAIAECDSVEWKQVSDEADYAHGCAQIELASNSYVSSWVQLLASNSGERYLRDRFVQDGSKTCPDGRLHFYSIVPIISSRNHVEFGHSTIEEIKDIMATMTEVIRNEYHPYVLWDLQESIPFQAGVRSGGECTSRPVEILDDSAKYLSEQWKQTWKVAGVPEFSELGAESHIANKNESYILGRDYRHPTTHGTSIYHLPDLGQVTVLPVDTEYMQETLEKYDVCFPIMEPDSLDYSSTMTQFSHIRIKPSFTFRVKTYFQTQELELSPLMARLKVSPRYETWEEQVIIGVKNNSVAGDSHFGGHEQLFSYSPLAVTEGDGTPMAYFEATLLYYLLNAKSLYGTILPANNRRLSAIYERHKRPKWRMRESEPPIWHPHYYRTVEGNHCVVFYLHSIDVDTSPQETIQRIVHVFQPKGYKMRSLFIEEIAYTNKIHGV
jgi:hypothetical protein